MKNKQNRLKSNYMNFYQVVQLRICLLRILVLLSTLLLSGQSFAAQTFTYSFSPNNSILPPTQVFKVDAKLQGKTAVVINFNIAQDYYIYKTRLKFVTQPEGLLNLAKLKLPAGLFLHSEKVAKAEDEVLAGNFILNIPLANPLPDQATFKLILTLQGCNGKSICYPPQEYVFDLDLEQANLAVAPDQDKNTQTSLWDHFKQLYQGNSNDINGAKPINIFELIVIFFLAGIAIALTPCMYPLYPIALSTIIGSNNSYDHKNTIKFALCYIHGIALVYVLMGFFAAISGKLLTTVLQKPEFMLFSAVILLLLGIAMFDLLDLKLSNRFQSYLHVKSSKFDGGRYITAFIIGILSSLLLGPCVTPPLIIAIGFIAKQGSVVLGIVGLYAIALGMGVPILILATIGNKLLPKSGNWMNLIKHIMGSIIIAASIYLAYPFIALGNKFISIGILCFVVALVFLIIKYSRPRELEMLIHRIVPILVIIVGLIYTIYGIKQLQTNSNAVKLIPSTQVISKDGFLVVKSKEQLENLIAQSDKPILLDFYASWCAICKEMAATTFSNPEVFKHLANYVLIQFDITNNTADDSLVLKQYGLYGPPALIILNRQHQVVQKLLGLTTSEKLITSTPE